MFGRRDNFEGQMHEAVIEFGRATAAPIEVTELDAAFMGIQALLESRIGKQVGGEKLTELGFAETMADYAERAATAATADGKEPVAERFTASGEAYKAMAGILGKAAVPQTKPTDTKKNRMSASKT